MGRIILCLVLIPCLCGQCGDPYQEGMELIEKGDFEEAARYFLNQKNLHPEDPRVHNQLGFCYSQLNMYRQAATMYSKALELRPDYFEAELNLGTIELKRNRWEGAKIHLQKAIELKPDCEPCYVNLAWTFFHMNRFDLAEQQVKRAIEASGDDNKYQDVVEAIAKRRKEVEDLREWRRATKAQQEAEAAVPDQSVAPDD